MSMNIDSEHPHFYHLKAIEEMVQRGTDLTTQLLGFARFGRYNVKPADLNEVIMKGSSMFGRTKKEIKIHTEFQQDTWTQQRWTEDT
nr:hypothetical protein [Desulfobacterales bacterium]